MSRKKSNGPRPPSDSATYEVGYGKPPVASRFQPGKCPNPKGRPRGSKNKPADADDLGEMVLREGERQMKVTEGDKVVSLTVTEGIVRRISFEALKGRYRQQRLWAELHQRANDRKDRLAAELMETWVAYKIKMEEKIADHARRGLPPPEMVVHPDQVVIDPYEGTLTLVGPMTRQAKEALEAEVEERTQTMREPVLQRIAELEVMLAETTDDDLRLIIVEAIAERQDVLKMVEETGARQLRCLTRGILPGTQEV